MRRRVEQIIESLFGPGELQQSRKPKLFLNNEINLNCFNHNFLSVSSDNKELSNKLSSFINNNRARVSPLDREELGRELNSSSNSVIRHSSRSEASSQSLVVVPLHLDWISQLVFIR